MDKDIRFMHEDTVQGIYKKKDKIIKNIWEGCIINVIYRKIRNGREFRDSFTIGALSSTCQFLASLTLY